jgi:DUF4097 and DUF4098 domain-containing protein YvlB
MMIALFTAAVLAVGTAPQADTTFAVRAGGSLELNTDGGSVTVGSWDRDAVRIVTARTDRSRPRIDVRGSAVTVHSESLRPGPANEDYTITVPRRFSVGVDGVDVVVGISGITGDVSIDNVEGAVRIRDVTGRISVESVSGGVAIENARGNVTVTTVNQGIRIEDVRGDIAVETVNGSIAIHGAESSHVRASTVNGVIEYDGAVRDGGSYYLGTHNGRIIMSLAERVNARVTAATSNGRVEAEFPIQLNAMRDGRAQFTLGNGSASVELQSFNGTVHLVRPAGR